MRLFQALDTCTAPIVWLCGDAGSGKTWGIARYVEERRDPCIWYQVDAEDREPSVLVAELGLALAEQLGQQSPARMAPVAATQLERHATRFFEGLLRSRSTPAHLVLDNVQDAGDDPAFISVLTGLFLAFRNLRPSGRRVFVTSRQRPPDTMARLIVDETIALPPAELLRFDRQEIAQLFTDTKQDASERIERVLQASDGWAASAALLARASDATTAGARHERLSAQVLTDYVETELLDRVPPPHRRALEVLAFLPRIEPRHMPALAGGLCLAEVIQWIERLGIPHVRDAREALRLHDLVRETLQHTFIHAPDPVPSGQPLAAALLDALWNEGQLHEAIRLAHTLTWHAELAALIVQHAGALLASGREAALAQALRTLPQERVNDSSWLTFWLGVLDLAHDPTGAALRLSRNYERFVAECDPLGAQLTAAAMVQSALLHPDSTQLQRWMKLMLQDLRTSLPEPIDARLTATELMVHHARAEGGPRVQAVAERGLALLSKNLPIADAIALCGPLALVFIFAGRFADARATLDYAQRLAGCAQFDQNVRLSFLYCASTSLMAAFGSAEEGLRYAEEVLELPDVHLPWIANVSFGGVALASALGEQDRASRMLALLEREALLRPNVLSKGRHLCARAQVRLAQQDIDGALADLAISVELAFESQFYVGAFAGLTLAAAGQVAHARFADARVSLDRLHALAEQKRSPYITSDALFIEAALTLEQHGLAAAQPALTRAFGTARSLGRHAGGMLPRATLVRLVGAALELQVETELALRMAEWARLAPPSDDLGPHWGWPLVLRALGPFNLVRATGGPAQAERTATALRPLMCLLATTTGSIALERLARELWPTRSAKASRSALDTAIHRLRKQLGDESLVVLDRGVLRLDTRRVWSDVGALQGLARRIEQQVHRASLADCERLAAQLFDVYRGAYCEGETQPAIQIARERFARTFVSSLERIVRRAVALEALDAATHWLELGLEREDSSELLHRACIELYVQRGLGAEAARALARCRNALRSRFPAAPSAQTERLVLAMRMRSED